MYFNSFLIKAILRKVQINLRKSKLNESNVICYLPEAERGFALPSIKQRRDALLIKQAYRCLNDPGHLGKIFRTRLLDLKSVTGHTTLLSFSLDFLMLIWTFLKMAFIKNELKYTGILVKIIQFLSINAPT